MELWVILQGKDAKSSGYSYGWSFLLSLLSFIGSEVSALLSFAAYMEQFGCQQDFLMIIPGMHRFINVTIMISMPSSIFRKIAEVQMRLSRDSSTFLSSSRLAAPNSSDHLSLSSPAPVDLLKCSFVHCPSPDSLTSRQVSFAQGDRQGNDSFHNLTSVHSGNDNSGSCSHSRRLSEQCDQWKSEGTNGFPTCAEYQVPNRILKSSEGHQVVLTTAQTGDTKNYAVTMSRISNNIYTKYKTSREDFEQR